MIEMRKNVKPGKTPEKITVSMIDQDLKDGISKPEMAIKYGIKPWEVDEMFKHPFLKGRRPSRKKALSFTFEDDTDEALMKKSSQELFDQIDELPLNSGDIAVEQAAEVDPNQITLEDAIQDTINETEKLVNKSKETNDAIVDLLGPHTQTPEETIKEAIEADISMEEEYDEDEDDDTFEL